MLQDSIEEPNIWKVDVFSWGNQETVRNIQNLNIIYLWPKEAQRQWKEVPFFSFEKSCIAQQEAYSLTMLQQNLSAEVHLSYQKLENWQYLPNMECKSFFSSSPPNSLLNAHFLSEQYTQSKTNENCFGGIWFQTCRWDQILTERVFP